MNVTSQLIDNLSPHLEALLTDSEDSIAYYWDAGTIESAPYSEEVIRLYHDIEYHAKILLGVLQKFSALQGEQNASYPITPNTCKSEETYLEA